MRTAKANFINKLESRRSLIGHDLIITVVVLRESLQAPVRLGGLFDCDCE